MPRTRLLLACLLLNAAAAGHAQTAPANVVTPAPPPREGTVGPEQLRDFSLPGTRQTPAPAPDEPVRPPREAPAPTVTRPAAPAVTRPAPVERREAPAADPARPVPPLPTDQAQAEPAIPQARIEPSFDFPAAPSPVAPELAPVPAPDLSTGEQSAPWWPWVLAAVLLGAALALVAWQRRTRRPAMAGAGDESLAFEPPSASPAPAPRPRPEPAPAPPPEPAAPLPSGLVTTRLRPARPAVQRVPEESPRAPAGAVVSTGLRPRVDLEVKVEELVLTEQEAIIRFRLTVANSGTAAARDITVEALPLNAGENQRAEIEAFFARTGATEVGVLELPRLGASELAHEVRMPRGAIREYEVQGRRLFVPVLAFLACYRWSGGTGRTGAAFLIGHDTGGSDRLAPLRFDSAATRLKGLGVRRLEEQVRQ